MPKKAKVPPPPPPPRIYWSDIEQEEIITRAANIVFKEPTRSALSALDGAQNAFLPAERRRKITTLSTVPWYRDGLIAAVEKLKQQLVQEEKFKIVEQVEIVRQELTEVSTDDLLGECFRRFLNAGGHSIIKQLSLSMAQCVRTELPHVIAQMKKQSEPEQKALRKIMVVGLLPEQAHEVEKDLRDCFDLHFWKDGAIDQLKQKAINMDKVFVMKRFIAHSYQDTLRSVGVSFTVVPGATSELLAVLERFYLESA